MKDKILNLYIQINNAKKQNHFTDTRNWEQKIDNTIYQIYDLTDTEINFIKNFELEFRMSGADNDN